ncbi:MAG: BlaI/MecI/CopY family transcriptional regulator [Bacteroidales bacterium]|nr:BlaI/MecI/CopY family transcriptional regulator [Bacteroidales bacterium]
MNNLSRSEEQLMGYLWKHKKAFLKDLILSHPKPQPAKTTVATLLKRLQIKGFVNYQIFGNSRQYFALIEKEDYFSIRFKEIISHHFNNSIPEFTSFITQTLKLDRLELDALKKTIDKEVTTKRNKDAVFY